MTATYLLTWNPKKSTWNGYSDDWEAVNLGYPCEIGWSCSNTKKIKIGDRIFMMQLGWQIPVNGIFASGWVTKEPYSAENWNLESIDEYALYIDFTINTMLNPELQRLFDPKGVSTDFNWHPQRSGVKIPIEIAEKLELAWQSFVEENNLTLSQTNYISPTVKYLEGSKSQILINRYERDPNARKRCIAEHGTSCKVCGFNFEHIYGEVGKDFIHVHHKKSISSLGGQYQVDPINDLVPVCPNCHAMLHRANPPLSIEELQRLIRKQ